MLLLNTTDAWGDYRDLNSNRIRHKDSCCHYTIATEVKWVLETQQLPYHGSRAAQRQDLIELLS